MADGSDPLDGSFALSMNNGTSIETTVDIPSDSSASELSVYLNALNNVGSVSISRSVLSTGYRYIPLLRSPFVS